ncbi:MAG: hypothetical protein EOO33_06090 [Comamonadaceae bacterium]|nr:MAG: hypothetical protein EOO33_06090 [Comamonadaceae bacterium]
MTTEFVQIYPADTALHTPDRQALYAELLEHIDLGEFTKKTFAPALKRLCFEGRIESRDERIGGLRDPVRRINPLGTYVHAYLCLASPVVSQEAFVEILQHYKQASVTDMAIDLTERFDGTRRHHASPALHARIRCLVQALRQVISAESFQYRCGRMFSGFLSRACYRGTTEHSLVTDCWDGVDQYVAPGNDVENIRSLATTLFSGEAEEPAGYQDAGVIAFCERYLQRQFGPHLLALLDDVYQAIDPARRLRVEHGAIVFPHLSLADIASAAGALQDEAAAATRAPHPDDVGTVQGTGLFCLVRSPSAAHSLAVAHTLRPTAQASASASAQTSAAAATDEAETLADTLREALTPMAHPDVLQRVDDTTLLLGWEAELDAGAGRAEFAACTAAGCSVLACALWMESGEVLHLHGLAQGQQWRFARARPLAGQQEDEDEGLVQELQDLLALLLATAAEPTGTSR